MAATWKPLLALLKKHDACAEACQWAKDYALPAEAWAACHRPDWLLWSLAELGLRDGTKDLIFFCRAMRETPLPDGRTVWDLLTDPRSRAAVEIAERFCRGEATEQELYAATKTQTNILREIYGNPFSEARP
jgi:hypothetical protein